MPRHTAPTLLQGAFNLLLPLLLLLLALACGVLPTTKTPLTPAAAAAAAKPNLIAVAWGLLHGHTAPGPQPQSCCLSFVAAGDVLVTSW
jgi:hypothetical protein